MIDGRAGAEPLTRTAEDQQRAIFAAGGASGTWDWDIAQDLLFVDDAFADLYGFDPAAAHGGLPVANFFSAIHPDDRARIRIAVAGILGGAELFSKEFRLRRTDGAVVWMHGRGQSQLDANDQPVRFTGLLVDVTERKRTEERLRIAQTAGGVGTFEYIDGFATVSVSKQFCRLLGLHPTTVLPVRTINSLVCEGSEPIIPEAEHGAAAAEVEQLAGEFHIVRNDDGAKRWIARRGEIIREAGAGYRFVGVIYDVTAGKEAQRKLRELNDTLETRVQEEVAARAATEEALRQAQKMEAVGQLTGGIAHDFNNLLTIIIGNIDTVIRRLTPASDSRAKRSLDNALKGAERAAALTQRLLAFSRQQPLAPKDINIGRLIAGMSDLLTRSINETIAIEIVSEPELWRAEVDPHQLENAILNLAVNARDAMANGGRLTIRSANLHIDQPRSSAGADPGHYVVVSVADTGSGMSPETLARVFDPFFTTKEVGKGTGLGLSMVYGFVKQTGGHVGIESAPGAGTTISLYLPALLDAIADEPVVVDDHPALGGASETILVVEDDDDVRAYTVEMLRELGYRVVEAHDPPSALRLLERQDMPVQLLLTDVVMPIMSGRELADAARVHQPDLRVLYTSGYPRDAIMQAGRLEDGVELLPKPFTYLTLSERVRKLIDRSPEKPKAE